MCIGKFQIYFAVQKGIAKFESDSISWIFSCEILQIAAIFGHTSQLEVLWGKPYYFQVNASISPLTWITVSWFKFRVTSNTGNLKAQACSSAGLLPVNFTWINLTRTQWLLLGPVPAKAAACQLLLQQPGPGAQSAAVLARQPSLAMLYAMKYHMLCIIQRSMLYYGVIHTVQCYGILYVMGHTIYHAILWCDIICYVAK